MPVNDTALMERYLAGELTNEEAQAFELRLQTDSEFAENFTALQGKFLFCLDEKELTEQLLQLQQQRWFHWLCRDE